MGWHWGVKGWGIIWIYVRLPDDFIKLFADLSPRCFDAVFSRNHHYEQHSELRKSAGQLRDEEVEVIAPICLDWRPQPMEIRRCCYKLTNFVVDKTRLLYPLGGYLGCLLPTGFFLSDLCRHHPSHPSPPKASLQNFLKTNKELVWKLKGETKQHGCFGQVALVWIPLMLAVYNFVRAKCVEQYYSTQSSSRDNRGNN